ncbi:MAG TPA: GNAT family N-acetyltransferase [Candidatus Ornithoclostridium excrementipullorum]|nr:GNAT family N-acetyltransferase [Candidatus Ornithoclostridium excrementipullorum]
MVNTVITPVEQSDARLLKDFTYHAVFVPKNSPAPSRDIVENPQLRTFWENFGQRGDIGFKAAIEEKTVGIAWTRLAAAYGAVGKDIPVLAISVLPEYRGRGIGSALLRAILGALPEYGFDSVSLSVQKYNFIANTYRKLGFIEVGENDRELIMIKNGLSADKR